MCCSRLAANTGRKKVAKNRHLGTIAQLRRAVSSQLRHVSTIGKKFLSSNTSSTCFYNMVNFGPLAAEIVSLVWGTPGNFNGFRVLAALLHGTLVVGISHTLRRWTEGATYIRQGGHHITFLVSKVVVRAHVTNTHIHRTDCSTWTTNVVCNYELSIALISLHFAWVVDDAKCILVTRVCVCVSVCPSPDVNTTARTLM